jgi:hypothetical protein
MLPHSGLGLAAGTETADRASCHCPIRRSRPIAGCPTAQATWGDVCSLARRISFFSVGDACMNLPFFVFGSGRCGPSFISSADAQVMPRDNFPRKPFFWE